MFLLVLYESEINRIVIGKTNVMERVLVGIYESASTP